MVRPSQRREMATWAVKSKGRSIGRACWLFGVSQTCYCYRYQPKLSGENERIADWLVRLTHNQRNWGFGLCYGVAPFQWTHDCLIFCIRLLRSFPSYNTSESAVFSGRSAGILALDW